MDGLRKIMQPTPPTDSADDFELIAKTELASLRALVEAAVKWRRNGLAHGREFAFGIDPLLQAIDAYEGEESGNAR